MIPTLNDIAMTEEERAEVDAYPTRPGWDAFTGHGRVNVGAAVEAVIDGAIPPGVRLTGPVWFSHHDDTVDVTGRVEGAAAWRLEMGHGLEPEVWQPVANGTGPVDGHLATVDHERKELVLRRSAASFKTSLSRLAATRGYLGLGTFLASHAPEHAAEDFARADDYRIVCASPDAS